MLVCKQRARVNRVDRFAFPTPMHLHLCAVSMPKVTRLFHTGVALRTAQPAGMKVLAKPELTQLIIADIKKWKVHITSLSP